MKYIKEQNNDTTTIYFREEDKQMRILYASRGNGDLYWSIYFKDSGDKHEIIITKEKINIYKTFEELFTDMKDINIFTEDDPFWLTGKERKKYIAEERKRHLEEKERCRLYGEHNYFELYDKDNEIITWYSDETNWKVANILKIKKEDDSFRVVFSIQPHIDGYDEDMNSENYISIRFRNSGSRYQPFNVVFMNMFNKLRNLELVDEDEYTTPKKKVKKI